jgi:hypothetical protein
VNSKWKQVLTKGNEEREFRDMNVDIDLFKSKLIDLLEKEVNALERNRDYDHSNWAYVEADRKGQVYAYELITKLIS